MCDGGGGGLEILLRYHAKSYTIDNYIKELDWSIYMLFKRFFNHSVECIDVAVCWKL